MVTTGKGGVSKLSIRLCFLIFQLKIPLSVYDINTYPDHYSTSTYNKLLDMGTDPAEINLMEQFMIPYDMNFHWDFDKDKCCLYTKFLNIPEEQERDFD